MDAEMGRIQEFIGANAVGYGDSAYEGYVTSGRGFVMVDYRKAEEGLHINQVPYKYIPASDVEEMGEGWPNENLRAEVERYDPEKQVVLAFVTERGVKQFVVTPAISPPDAYEQTRDSGDAVH